METSLQSYKRYKADVYYIFAHIYVVYAGFHIRIIVEKLYMLGHAMQPENSFVFDDSKEFLH
jgi:hypothetical protein